MDEQNEAPIVPEAVPETVAPTAEAPAPVEEVKAPEVKPKPRWVTKACDNHDIVNVIDALEVDGYEIFDIYMLKSGQFDSMVIAKIK